MPTPTARKSSPQIQTPPGFYPTSRLTLVAKHRPRPSQLLSGLTSIPCPVPTTLAVQSPPSRVSATNRSPCLSHVAFQHPATIGIYISARRLSVAVLSARPSHVASVSTRIPAYCNPMSDALSQRPNLTVDLDLYIPVTYTSSQHPRSSERSIQTTLFPRDQLRP